MPARVIAAKAATYFVHLPLKRPRPRIISNAAINLKRRTGSNILVKKPGRNPVHSKGCISAATAAYRNTNANPSRSINEEVFWDFKMLFTFYIIPPMLKVASAEMAM